MSLPAAVPAGQDLRGLATGGPVIGAPAKDPSHAAKLNQVVQNFFSKAAQVIIQSRMPVNSVIMPGNPDSTDPTAFQKKTNKWFNLELDDTDTFRDELRLWKAADAALVTASFASLPPLLIETVLDTRDLTANQTLVVLDDEGKRWNVEAAATAGGIRADIRRPEVVLERWRVELDPRSINALGVPPELPVVYKRSIVLFRSLYAYVRLLPAWRFRKKLSKAKLNPSSLKISCRVLNGAYPVSSRGRIGLSMPLVLDRKDNTQSHTFNKIDTPAGAFTVQVTYRKNCEFRVDDSESILSSHFINLDEHSTKRYANTTTAAGSRRYSRPSKSSPANSLPSAHSPSRELSQQDPGLSYGSLSSFHPQSTAVPGASPLSALRGAVTGSSLEQESSFPSSLSSSASRNVASGTKNALKPIDPSRPSIQPFKSPALSASPSSDSMAPGGGSYPRLSYYRGSSSSSISNHQQRTQRPNLSSTASGGQRQSTSISPINTFNPSGVLAVSSTSASSSGSRQESSRRYSSSFGSRSQWHHESTPSSSATVAAQQVVVDGSVGGSETQSDDDNDLGEFVRMLDSRRPLKLFTARRDSAGATSPAGGAMGTSAPRTSLARFQQLRDSHAMLSDSMSTSVVIQQRSPVPVSGSYSSTGSGGSGKAVSPHTPHTPAIPSRLSEGLTVEYYRDQPVFEDDDDEVGVLESHDDENGGSRCRTVKKPGLAKHDEEDELALDTGDDSSMSLAPAPQTHIVAAATSRSNSCGSAGMLRGSIAKRAALRSSPSGGSVHSNEVSSHGEHYGDDDELLFAMSDMVVGTNTLPSAPARTPSPKVSESPAQSEK
ncbi:autophagy-related protein 13-domain-containing protein [Lipomyces kononenkoae]